MTAREATPEDVARLVRAARAVDGMLDVRPWGTRWQCAWCLRTADPHAPTRAIPHKAGCIVAAYRAALAPWADAREEGRDGPRE